MTMSHGRRFAGEDRGGRSVSFVSICTFASYPVENDGDSTAIRHDSSRKPLREKSNLLNGFNLIWVVQLSTQRYTSSLLPQISGYCGAVPPRQEGRIAIVTNARRDVVDAAASGAQDRRRVS
jgi:hypothetical protein